MDFIETMDKLYNDTLEENYLNNWDYTKDDFIADIRYACDYLEEMNYIKGKED